MAKVFFFPSLYEGFGFPPLEAMQSGVPVLTSNASSLPEIVGEGGILHEPDECQGFANDIIKILEDENFYQEMKGKAILQAQKFRCEKFTEQLVDIFDVI